MIGLIVKVFLGFVSIVYINFVKYINNWIIFKKNYCIVFIYICYIIGKVGIKFKKVIKFWCFIGNVNVIFCCCRVGEGKFWVGVCIVIGGGFNVIYIEIGNVS